MNNKNHDLKANYKKSLELAMIAALLISVVVSVVLRKVELAAACLQEEAKPFGPISPPPTSNPKPPTPPKLPSVPIPSAEELLPEDATIDPTVGFLYEELSPPEPPSPYIPEPFFIYDEPPKIKRMVINYPETARKIGLEGIVIVSAFVNVRGRVTRTRISKSSGYQILDDAAEQTLKESLWQPARQRDKAVSVWVNVPVKFRLH